MDPPGTGRTSVTDTVRVSVTTSGDSASSWHAGEYATGITAHVLLLIGDHDFTTVEHGALMLQLIPGSQLAVLPGTTHMQITRRADLLLPMLARFLD